MDEPSTMPERKVLVAGGDPPRDGESPAAAELRDELRALRAAAVSLPERINVEKDSVEQGLGKLVLTLIEMVRRLLEKQAIRRMEGGSLDAEQIEELGLALMKLEEKMKDLKTQFHLENEDLNLDLGPLGRLI